MVFPILWVLPCISATVGTMGFAMYTPMGFPILCVLHMCFANSFGTSMGLAYALIVAVDDDDNIFDLAMIDGDGDGDGCVLYTSPSPRD